LAQRARIVLAADGLANAEIARRIGSMTHWSARLLAAEPGIGFATAPGHDHRPHQSRKI
jgi:hypothetical protein